MDNVLQQCYDNFIRGRDKAILDVFSSLGYDKQWLTNNHGRVTHLCKDDSVFFYLDDQLLFYLIPRTVHPDSHFIRQDFDVILAEN